MRRERAVHGRAAENMAAAGPPNIDLASGGAAVGGLLVSGLKFAKQKTQEAAAFVDEQRAESSCRRLEREHAAQFAMERRGGGGAAPAAQAASMGSVVGGAMQDALFVAGRAGSAVAGRISAAGDATMSEAMTPKTQQQSQVRLPFGDDEQPTGDGEVCAPRSQVVPLPYAAPTVGDLALARECIASSLCGLGCRTVGEHMVNSRASTVSRPRSSLHSSQPHDVIPSPAVGAKCATEKCTPNPESMVSAGDTDASLAAAVGGTLSLRCATCLLKPTQASEATTA